MSSNEQKNTPGIPVRRVNLGTGESEPTGEEEKVGTQPPKGQTAHNVDKTPNVNRAEILRRAREAKKLKSEGNATNITVPTVEPVQANVETDNDNDSDVVDGLVATTAPDPVLVSPTRKRKLSAALLKLLQDADETEEPPSKKSKNSNQDPENVPKSTAQDPVRNFFADKVTDVGRLLVASGVASVAMVILKGVTSNQLNSKNSPGEINSDWVKQ